MSLAQQHCCKSNYSIHTVDGHASKLSHNFSFLLSDHGPAKGWFSQQYTVMETWIREIMKHGNFQWVEISGHKAGPFKMKLAKHYMFPHASLIFLPLFWSFYCDCRVIFGMLIALPITLVYYIVLGLWKSSWKKKKKTEKTTTPRWKKLL